MASNHKIKLKDHLTVIPEDGIVVDIEQDKIVQYNDVGIKILELCNEENSLEEIARKIASIYNVEPKKAYKDVEEFLDHLRQKNYII